MLDFKFDTNLGKFLLISEAWKMKTLLVSLQIEEL